jgi:hypothetical protein
LGSTSYLEKTHSRHDLEKPLRAKWGETLVLVGVMGEFGFGLIAFGFSGRIDTRLRAHIAVLELYNAPRWINVVKVGDALKQYAGTPYVIDYIGHPECDRIANLISMALQEAQWKPMWWRILPMGDLGEGIDISVMNIPTLPQGDAKPAAAALFSILARSRKA